MWAAWLPSLVPIVRCYPVPRFNDVVRTLSSNSVDATASRPGDRNKGIFASVSVCRTMIRSSALWSIRSLVLPMQRIERPLRLTSGLVLFAYATSHLVNNAFGIRSIEAMESAGLILHKPWTTLAGLFVLSSTVFLDYSRYTVDATCGCLPEKCGNSRSVLPFRSCSFLMRVRFALVNPLMDWNLATAG
jgi:hypothetical protein